MAAARLPSCIVRPQQTEGPFFLDDPSLERADIRSDPADGSVREGVPLELTFLISRLNGGACAPLAGAVVDLWQCDARGVYSAFEDTGNFDTRGRKFLRGYQRTDQSGAARFITIFPGWYPTRAVHVHFKVRGGAGGRGRFEFTSQLYFDDAVIEEIHGQGPYGASTGRRLRNAEDGIFRRGGRELLVPIRRRGQGWAGTFEIGLQV